MINCPVEELSPHLHSLFCSQSSHLFYFDVCRYPKGQQKQSAEDAMERIPFTGGPQIQIHLNIIEFGYVCLCYKFSSVHPSHFLAKIEKLGVATN
jgi:hypothetical protein